MHVQPSCRLKYTTREKEEREDFDPRTFVVGAVYRERGWTALLFAATRAKKRRAARSPAIEIKTGIDTRPRGNIDNHTLTAASDISRGGKGERGRRKGWPGIRVRENEVLSPLSLSLG